MAARHSERVISTRSVPVPKMPSRPKKPENLPARDGHPGRAAALIAGALFVLTLAVFWTVADNDFVNYDDPDYVTSNPHVQEGFTWPNIKWAFSTGPGHASNWHPVTWLS